MPLSLNHKRRIFRPNPRSGASIPPLSVWLAAIGGAATILIAASLFLGPSEAPARAPASSRIAASADRIAVVDGDTLRVGEHIVRLAGIAAPARGSVCHGDGPAELDCGAAAANAASALVRGQAIACTIGGHDGQGRPVGTCFAGSTSIGTALVRDGWAHAETADLQGPESDARAAGRGIWHRGS